MSNPFRIKIPAALALGACLAAFPVLAGENCHGKDAKKTKGSQVEANTIKTGKEKDYSKFKPISRENLVKAMEKKEVFLIDANGEEKYSKGHIPGAVNLHLAGDKFAEMLPEDKDALIVAYCGGPGCEAWCQAADKLDALGYTNVRHYKGGIKEWRSAGMEVAKPVSSEKS